EQNTGGPGGPQAMNQTPSGTVPHSLPALQALLDVAVEAAGSAAAVLRERAGDIRSLTWQQKGTADFVTEVDLAAEARVREVVRRRLPEAVIAGEEESPDSFD